MGARGRRRRHRLADVLEGFHLGLRHFRCAEIAPIMDNEFGTLLHAEFCLHCLFAELDDRIDPRAAEHPHQAHAVFDPLDGELGAECAVDVGEIDASAGLSK